MRFSPTLEGIWHWTWLVTMGGGYPNYYYSHTAWTFFQPFPESPGYAAHRRYTDFWRTTRY